MSIQKKLFYSHLVIIFLTSSLFLLLWRFAHFVNKSSLLFYSSVCLILLTSLFVSLLLSRAFSEPMRKVIRELEKLEEGKYERIHIKPGKEMERLSKVINRISKKTRENEQKLRILFDISRIVSSLLHLQKVLDAIVELLVKEFKLDACAIRLLGDDGNLRIKSQQGFSNRFSEQAARKPTIETYAGECFLTGQYYIVNDTEKIEKPVSTSLLVGENIKSFVVLPIEVEGKRIGVLDFASKNKDYFRERFFDVSYIVSNHIGVTIRASQLYEEIYRFSRELEKKVEERTASLEEKRRQLVEAERLAALGKMSNRVAHEVRNSSTVIGGFARRLHEKTPDSDPNKKYFLIMVEEVMALESKISKLIKVDSPDSEP